MSQPLYFLPRVQWHRGQSLSITRSLIREAGLADTFSDVSEDHVGYNQLPGRGPGDLSGSIIFYCDREPPRRLGYYPAEQQWTSIGDGSQLWVGVDSDESPTPENLQKRRIHPGYPLELGDGKTYTIPVVRRPDGSTNLPTDMVFDAAGKLQEPIKPAYTRYWETSAEVCQWFFGGEAIAPDKARALQLAIEVLGLNYRYGMAEHSALRLIDATNFLAILALSVDLPRVQMEQEAQKKR